MVWRRERSTRSDTRLTYTTLYRSSDSVTAGLPPCAGIAIAAPGVCRPLRMLSVSWASVLRASGPCADVKSGIPGSATLPLAPWQATQVRSEEHTSELQSLMRISYADFCLKHKITPQHSLSIL